MKHLQARDQHLERPSGSPLIDWQDTRPDAWGLRPLRIGHRLHESPHFSRSTLAQLIEGYPRRDYSLAETSRQGEGRQRWREGEIGQMSGEKVLDAIASGSLWLNMRNVDRHYRAFADLLNQCYAELSQAIPGFKPGALKMGILISSPRAQVHYHADLPGQALWQIAGRKQVWVYPRSAPYLTPHALEDIAFSGIEFKLPYRPEFDRDAVVFDLEPGQWLTWPLNAPHRVENRDCLNISVTTEHWTPENRRSQQLSLANAVLRHRLGYNARSQALSGGAFWAKWALQAAWRRSPWARKAQQQDRPIVFQLGARGTSDLLETDGGRL